MRVTAILNGQSGELDRVAFKPRDPDYWTLSELVAAVERANGGRAWVLGDGDTITITQAEF